MVASSSHNTITYEGIEHNQMNKKLTARGKHLMLLFEPSLLRYTCSWINLNSYSARERLTHKKVLKFGIRADSATVQHAFGQRSENAGKGHALGRRETLAGAGEA